MSIIREYDKYLTLADCQKWLYYDELSFFMNGNLGGLEVGIDVCYIVAFS